jgi:hypothetical protein
MICPHCGLAVLPTQQWRQNVKDGYEEDDDPTATYIEAATCASCHRVIVTREDGEWYGDDFSITASQTIWPTDSSRGRTAASDVPRDVASLFEEASVVLPVSPRASAALSRRCLQQVLSEAGGAPKGDLFNQIEQVVNSGALPSHLVDSLHAVRAIGNIAAHTQKSTTTGDVVDVEPGEAEWNLDTLEGLFDFYYVAPAKTAARKAALNAKQNAIGKPPIP